MNTEELISVMQLDAGASLVEVTFNVMDLFERANETREYSSADGCYTWRPMQDKNDHNWVEKHVIQKNYHYKNIIGLSLAAGDLVVVQANDRLALATVVDPDISVNALKCRFDQLKHVVSKVDLDALRRITEAENKAKHALALSEVRTRLKAFSEQIGDDAIAAARDALQLSSN